MALETLAVVSERAPGEPGGLAVAAERIARHAAQNGVRVHLVCWSKLAAPGARSVAQHAGITLHHVGRLTDRTDALQALTDHLSDVIADHAVQLVHAINAVYAGYAGVLAARLAGIPSIVSARGNDLDRGLFRSDQLPFVSHALTHASAVTGVSSALCARAHKLFARDVTFVANSVDASAFRPETPDNSLRASLALGQDPCIGFVGELREKKGMRFLLPAFAELTRQRPLRLLLIGGIRGECAAAMSEFRRSAPAAAERIVEVPYERNPARLSRLLALCNLVVFPSLYEGMPNALLEAMAAARPVLATDVGGHRDLIAHGDTGALLSTRDLDRLPEAIAEMLDLGETERAALGSRARAHVMTQHSPETERDAYAEVYRRAIALRSEARATPAPSFS
ncbi:MAG TPA: glycosyltransferase [Polyangiaceae bacterium]|nr:glycosyltransferase [Polyangiaceae bacterium]